ncbi:unnamed protein product [Hydatigera taeniaeformis]|uniref:EGF-like domain-containing protein n=1 Tax=Hydatigena taeniaeformis TaxID=6205 RepID=A0A0R3WX64_HYDTA|nr:unnamed protein product [Hydatigera taeniaeformis]
MRRGRVRIPAIHHSMLHTFLNRTSTSFACAFWAGGERVAPVHTLVTPERPNNEATEQSQVRLMHMLQVVHSRTQHNSILGDYFAMPTEINIACDTWSGVAVAHKYSALLTHASPTPSTICTSPHHASLAHTSSRQTGGAACKGKVSVPHICRADNGQHDEHCACLLGEQIGRTCTQFVCLLEAVGCGWGMVFVCVGRWWVRWRRKLHT